MKTESRLEKLMVRASGVLGAAGIKADDSTYANAYGLILEAGLKEVTNTVRFNVINSGGREQFITEVRLFWKDVFLFDKWGLFLLNTESPTDVHFEEHTCPDPAYFRAEDAAEAEIFYNSNLELVIDNMIVLPGIRTDVFKKYISVKDRRNEEDSGLREVADGCVLLVGSKNIHFELRLPRGTKWPCSEMRVRLRLSGLLIRNVSVIE